MIDHEIKLPKSRPVLEQIFLQIRCHSCRPSNSIKALKDVLINEYIILEDRIKQHCTCCSKWRVVCS